LLVEVHFLGHVVAAVLAIVARQQVFRAVVRALRRAGIGALEVAVSAVLALVRFVLLVLFRHAVLLEWCRGRLWRRGRRPGAR
jgi:ABC-type uncharacterized transport system YnjBCD permease subunit